MSEEIVLAGETEGDELEERLSKARGSWLIPAGETKPLRKATDEEILASFGDPEGEIEVDGETFRVVA